MVNLSVSLKPVVEMPYSLFDKEYRWELADLPHGYFLPLSGELTLPEIGIVIALLMDYNQAETLTAVLEAECLLLPGGVGIYRSNQPHIMPGCCCGLECWREWEAFAESGTSPWCGHDPEATLRQSDGQVIIDQTLYNEIRHATLALSSFREELKTVEKSLQDFIPALKAWEHAVGLDNPGTLSAKFNECFDIGARW